MCHARGGEPAGTMSNKAEERTVGSGHEYANETMRKRAFPEVQKAEERRL